MFLTRPSVSQSVSPVFLVSATPLKPLNKISWNFVVMKDIMCRYAFLQEMLIWSFWGAIYIPFFVRLPITYAWNCHSLYTAFSSNVGAWGMWACSLFLSLNYTLRAQTATLKNQTLHVFQNKLLHVIHLGCLFCTSIILNINIHWKWPVQWFFPT